MRLLLLLLACALAPSLWAVDPASESKSSPPLVFYGPASATKEVNSVPVGSVFIETDTNKTYRWKGSISQGSASDWVELYQGVTLGTRLACESGFSQSLGICNAMPRCTALSITGANSVAIKTGPGVLQSVVVDSFAATDDFVVYDSLTAANTVLLSVTNAVVGAPFVATNLGMSFSTGLSVGGTGWTAGSRISICYL